MRISNFIMPTLAAVVVLVCASQPSEYDYDESVGTPSFDSTTPHTSRRSISA